MKTGIKQDSVLPPLLFKTFVDGVIRKIKEEVGDIDRGLLEWGGESGEKTCDGYC